MNKIFEALKKLLPADQVREVAQAVEEMVAEARAELEAEFNANLTRAYDQISEELQQAEAVAEEGYKQAYQIIAGQQLALENAVEEAERAAEEGYEEAWAMIKAEQTKNLSLETKVYEEYNNKLEQMFNFMVEKVDSFLTLQNAEIYEQARTNVLNDPRMVEHKVALDKILEVASQYVSEDDFAGATSAKLNDAQRNVEDLKGHLRVLEARNIRLNNLNKDLNESVRSLKNVLNENTRTERTERTRTAKNASGRGNRALGRGEQILTEHQNTNLPANRRSDDQYLMENDEVLRDLLVLSGVEQND
jgi:hypothetical protein